MTTKMPSGLRVSGRRLWRDCVAEYDFEVHEQLLLLQACRTADRLDSLATEADAHPPTVVNARGEQVAHPAMVEGRQQALTLARLLASLRLPAGEEGGVMTRPQRRGAARGPYGVRAAS
jgi:hypothetical protein